MADGQEPFEVERTIDEPSRPPVVPFARPISVPIARPVQPSPHDILLLYSSRGAALADVGIAVAVMVMLEALTALVVLLCFGWDAVGSEALNIELERTLLTPILAVRALAVAVLVVALLHVRRQPLRSVGVEYRGLGLNLALGAGGTVVIYALMFSVMFPLLIFVEEMREQMAQNAENLSSLLPKLTPLGLAGVAMAVGIYEELLFRGFLMTRLRRVFGNWPAAVLVSTIVFTALHAFDQTPAALLMIAILSIVFSVLTIWRKSIIPAVIAHALFDFSQFLLMYFTAGDSWA